VTFCAAYLSEVVVQFCNFLSDPDYVDSVLIIYIKPDFESAPFTLKTQEDESKIIAALEPLTRWLAREVAGQSLSALRAADTRLILRYDYKFSPNEYEFTLYGGAPIGINTNWPNTGDINQLEEKAVNAIRAPKNAPIYGISFDLNLPVTLGGLWCADLPEMAVRANSVVQRLLDKWDRKNTGVNVVSVDFITEDLALSIIKLNYEREYSQ